MIPPLEKRPEPENAGSGMSTVAQSSSQHPRDWGRALASAVSQLVEQIIETTGTDPCGEPDGLELTLHFGDLPGGTAITASWLPAPSDTTELSSLSLSKK